MSAAGSHANRRHVSRQEEGQTKARSPCYVQTNVVNNARSESVKLHPRFEFSERSLCRCFSDVQQKNNWCVGLQGSQTHCFNIAVYSELIL